MEQGAVFFQVVGVLIIIDTSITVRAEVAPRGGSVRPVMMITQGLAIVEGASSARRN